MSLLQRRIQYTKEKLGKINIYEVTIMIDNVILTLQKQALIEIDKNSNHELPLPFRKRIWKEMGPLLIDGNKAIRGVGLYRRTSLALIVVKKVYHIYARQFDVEVLDAAILNTEKYLRNGITWDEGWDINNNIGARVSDTFEIDQRIFFITYVGKAAWCALSTSLYDECFELNENGEIVDDNELDNNLDGDMWDASFYAAMAYAGGAPWEEGKCNHSKLKEFWDWYVKEAVPQAFEKAEQYL